MKSNDVTIEIDLPPISKKQLESFIDFLAKLMADDLIKKHAINQEKLKKVT